MSWLSFIAGMGAGAFVTTLGIIGFVKVTLKTNTKAQDRVFAYNEKSLAALEERNRIDKDIYEAVRSVARAVESK